MRPVCASCQRFMVPLQNGMFFEEGMPKAGSSLPERADSRGIAPYKLWTGDLYACELCNARVIVGTGHQAVAEHYQPEYIMFAERMKTALMKVRVA